VQLRVLFFGQLREITGAPEAPVDLPAHATVQSAFDHFARKFPPLEKFRPALAASINQEYAQWNAPLHDGDEIAFLPPVSGG
jgi:MoaE-MoaD fusion protein